MTKSGLSKVVEIHDQTSENKCGTDNLNIEECRTRGWNTITDLKDS